MMKFLSCDWGTSSFRLRIVNLNDARIEGEHVNEAGIQTTFNKYIEAGNEANRVKFYFDQLKKEIRQMSENLQVNLEGMLIVCSGMASSSIGIKELPYSDLPIDVNGNSVGLEYFPMSEDFDYSLLLVSGLRSSDNVMRGEETQLIGVVRQLENFSGNGIFILPGTHSKHIKVEGYKVSNFKTYMTGEVFQLMAYQSILSKSVKSNSNEKYKEIFEVGVKEGASSALLSVLFKARTNELFGRYSKEENFHYLSGLLIGNELSNLVEEKDSCIYLCSEGKLHPNYVIGMETLGLHAEVLPEEWVRKSVIHGQIQILNQNINNEKNIFLGSF
ncbi:MAG: 2-dehydro-3-deoxygalactonokinase [Cytophagales bacterium]|nr:2-dehydro-3-deoxygalactonokinase [Cytophagales bacterium]